MRVCVCVGCGFAPDICHVDRQPATEKTCVPQNCITFLPFPPTSVATCIASHVRRSHATPGRCVCMLAMALSPLTAGHLSFACVGGGLPLPFAMLTECWPPARVRKNLRSIELTYLPCFPAQCGRRLLRLALKAPPYLHVAC